MAAGHTLPQHSATRKSPIGKSGVLTLAGFGVRVRMQTGHLEIDGNLGRCLSNWALQLRSMA